MAKALKTAALVVGAVALVSTGIGAAAGAGIGLGLSASTLGTIATVASIANVASGVLAVATSLTAKKPTSQATGSQTSFAADPDAGIPWVIGRTGTAGNIVARFGFDTRDAGDNDRQSFVAVLSLGPVQAIESFSADRSPVTFDSGGRAIGGFSTFMWQTRQTGALSGPALGFGTGAGTPPGWSASHRLSGKAAATWTLRFDTKAKLYQNGVPAPMWVVQGALCYDPRKDSSYPGGSGSHRMADPADTAAYDAAVATWEYTENPYILGLRFIHGIWQRDTSNAASKWQRVMGMGAPQAGIDIASYVEGANVADANGWKAGGVIYSGDDKWGSLKKILQAGMGEPLALGAKIGCLVNAPKVSLATIGIDDVVGDASVGATQPRRSRINTITPRYRLEANNWQLLPGAPIAVADHIATDRGRRSRVQDYPFIQNSSQVGTAVRYDIENAREFGPIVLPLKLYWMGYKPGDCVTASLPELGLNAQPILLLNRSLDPSGGIVTMTARSETPGKHPFALGQTATPPPTPGVTGAPIVPTPGETAWAITGLELTSGEATVPALIITGAVDAGSPDAVVFEYRPFSSGQGADAGWIAAGIEPPTTTRKEIVSVTGDTAYEVSITYRARGVQSGRRILGPVVTAPLTALEGPPGPPGEPGEQGEPGAPGKDGSSAYALIQSNENHIVPANADGTVISYNGATTTIQVIYNGQDVSSSFALSLTSGGNPQALATTISGRTVTVTGGLDANEPNALLGLTLTGSGTFTGQVLNTSFSLTKSRAGADGSSPPLIAIDASAQLLRADKTGAFVPGQTFRFTVSRSAMPGTPLFSLYNSSGNLAFIGTAADFQAAAPAQWSTSGPNDLFLGFEGAVAQMNDLGGVAGRFSIGVSVAGYLISDTVTIQKIRDGEDGFVLSANPPTFQVPAFSNGTAKPIWTGGSCVLSLNKGGQTITPDGGYSIAAQTSVAGLAINGNTVTFAGVLADKAEFTARAIHQGNTYDQRVTITRPKDGEAAFKGSAVISGSGTQATGSGVTVVPSGRSVIVSGVADYTINQAQPGNFRGSMALYWRNVTDGGAWNLLGSQDGSFATSTNVGSSAEPEYQYISGTVSASFGFVAPSGDKQIAFEARVSRSGGDRTADIGGQIKLEVSS